MRNLTVMAERAGQEPVVASIIRTAFGKDKPVHLVERLRSSTAWRGLSFLGVIDEIPVAHVAFTRGWLDTSTKIIEVLILSPMSVLPDWQRQGIGYKLISECLTVLATRDEPIVFLEGDPNYYCRLGFLPGHTAGFLSPSPRIPDEAFQYFLLPKYENRMMGRLVYSDPFWETGCVGRRP